MESAAVEAARVDIWNWNPKQAAARFVVYSMPVFGDCILATRDTDVLALIEDEIILRLPISPRHTDAECSIAPLDLAGGMERDKPLAALAGLKKLH